jgi:3-dehydroquinate synthase
MTRVTITVQPCPYDAIIENGLLERAGEHLRRVMGNRQHVFVVTVSPVRRKWGTKLLDSLSAAGFKARVIEMRDGEPAKKLATIEALAEHLTRMGADRDAAVVAFGGGVVGDTAGLLASLYMRGVDLVQIPTTVQAQLDAAIGGKTGVNLRSGKNLLGTFHQPRAVFIDPTVLSTLPDRQSRLERVDAKALRRDASALEWVITESVRLKAEIVSSDERENGLRRVLNFGHTVGHALEAESGYRHFLHGEAVAWGMIAATHIAVMTGRIDNNNALRISNAVLNLGLLPKIHARSRDLVRLLQSDKKTRNGKIHFVLPREIGKVEIVNDVPEKVVTVALDELRRLSKS